MTGQKVEESRKVKLLTFRVAHFGCAMYAEHVREIVPMPAMTKIPGQPSILEGFVDLRGAILPIVRLAALFDLAFTPSAWSHVLVARISGSDIGLLVDGVDDLLTVDASELHPLAASQSINECATAGFNAGDRKYVLLDASVLLLAEEKARLAELETQVRQRLASVGKAEM
jgi:purine-binding chemotaxis protein CheW